MRAGPVRNPKGSHLGLNTHLHSAAQLQKPLLCQDTNRGVAVLANVEISPSHPPARIRGEIAQTVKEIG